MLTTIIFNKEQKHETTQILPTVEHKAWWSSNQSSPFIAPKIHQIQSQDWAFIFGQSLKWRLYFNFISFLCFKIILANYYQILSNLRCGYDYINHVSIWHQFVSKWLQSRTQIGTLRNVFLHECVRHFHCFGKEKDNAHLLSTVICKHW